MVMPTTTTTTTTIRRKISGKQDLKSYVRYDGNGMVVPGSNILQRWMPKVGKWIETIAHECCPPSTTLRVGDEYQGGKICYLFTSRDEGYVEGEQHGLILATENPPTIGCLTYPDGGTPFSNIFSTEIGTTSAALGTGLANSLAIVSQEGHLCSAAQFCLDWEHDGYSDWYLPSNGEWDKVVEAINAGVDFNLDGGWYRSSTEYDAGHAYLYQLPINIMSGHLGKALPLVVRAMRTF